MDLLRAVPALRRALGATSAQLPAALPRQPWQPGGRCAGHRGALPPVRALALCPHQLGARRHPQPAPLLGSTRAVSEDVVRRAMQRIDERTGLGWLAAEVRACVEPVLSQPWIAAPAAMRFALRGIRGRHWRATHSGHRLHRQTALRPPARRANRLPPAQARASEPLLPQLLHGIEATLRLSGWSRARRVVLVREAPALAPRGDQRPAAARPEATRPARQRRLDGECRAVGGQNRRAGHLAGSIRLPRRRDRPALPRAGRRGERG